MVQPDTWRAASALVDAHGDDTPLFAAMDADDLLKAGDMDGYLRDVRVVGAVKSLLSSEPGSARTH